MKKTFYSLYKTLYSTYGPQSWWPAKTDFEVMIGAILVQNTRWTQVEKALIQLTPYMSPTKIDQLSEEKLSQLIRSTGFYNVKAQRIKAFMSWFKTYNFSVTEIKKLNFLRLREELLSITGIGRETADVMLVYVFQHSAFVVDAYARKIFYRLGWDMPQSYDAFRAEVESQLPDSYTVYNEFHALLVEHAKTICTAVPRCHECPLITICNQRISD
ncbi:endonuclease III domain-containing protein [Virgibacillus sp. W0430]|uniref:endonuclease III domain-containing protein n=1 Tax=Virgibacillus sp. W0430 TaxID=3391580 RepID=UPI003F48CD0D